MLPVYYFRQGFEDGIAQQTTWAGRLMYLEAHSDQLISRGLRDDEYARLRWRFMLCAVLEGYLGLAGMSADKPPVDCDPWEALDDCFALLHWRDNAVAV